MVLDGLVVSILAILVGLYVGLLHGGVLRNLGLARIRSWGLLVAGIVLPVLVSRADTSNGVALVVVALVSLVVFTRRNRHLFGMGIVALGVCANLAVVVVNNAMPVRGEALVDAGLAQAHEVDHVQISGVQRLERPGDRLVFLGDVIPFAATKQVLSPGDLVILAGLGTVASNLVRNRTRPSPVRVPRDGTTGPPPSPTGSRPRRDRARHQPQPQLPESDQVTAELRVGDLVSTITPGR